MKSKEWQTKHIHVGCSEELEKKCVKHRKKSVSDMAFGVSFVRCFNCLKWEVMVITDKKIYTFLKEVRASINGVAGHIT